MCHVAWVGALRGTAVHESEAHVVHVEVVNGGQCIDSSLSIPLAGQVLKHYQIYTHNHVNAHAQTLQLHIHAHKHIAVTAPGRMMCFGMPTLLLAAIF